MSFGRLNRFLVTSLHELGTCIKYGGLYWSFKLKQYPHPEQYQKYQGWNPPPHMPLQPPHGGLTSLTPPPTPSAASIPRPNAGSNYFVPRAKLTLKKPDGTEVDLEKFAAKTIPPPASSTTVTLSPQGSVYRQDSPGTRPASIRIESKKQRKKRLAEERQREESSRIKVEEEETTRKEKEKAERKVKEAEEKKRLEEETEKERVRKEEDAKRLKLEEEERLRKEAEEREAKRVREEEERKRKEKEELEAKRLSKEKAKEEEERLEKERVEKKRAVKEEAKRRKLEERSLKKLEALRLWKQKEKEKEERLQKEDAATKEAEAEAGLLDLTGAKTTNVSSGGATRCSLATARIITDINIVQYPEGVRRPHSELNQNAQAGKFRYDQDFLLQFMPVCKEKPAMLTPLDAIGLEPVDQHHMSRGGPGRKGSGSPPSRQGSIGLGFSPATFNGKPTNPFNMGNFATPRASKLSSEERFAMSTSARAASVSGASGMQFTAGREQKATRSPPIVTKEENTSSNTLARPHPETYSQWYPPMSLQLPLGYSQDGADPNESQAHAGSAVSDAFGMPSEDSKESDIAIIKHHIRSLVRRMKEEQNAGSDTQELTLNRINSISVMDEEEKKIIAIINLLVNADETT